MRGIVILYMVVVMLAPSLTHAAMLYLDPPREVLQQGDATMISIRLDVDQESGLCVNAGDVVVTYPDNIQAVDVSTRRSIFPLWIEPPTIDAENNRVTFAGGIPNGYCGRIEGDPGLTNVLAEIVFRSAQPVSTLDGDGKFILAEVKIDDSSILTRNDGIGAPFIPEMFGATISVFPSAGIRLRDPWREIVQADTQPPEPFSVQLDRDPNIFKGDYFITFNTTDKQSGIAGYQVMEEPFSEQHLFRFGEVGAPWVETRSPHRLEDQTLNSTIRVRAIDKAGNEYVATLVPDPSLRARTMRAYEWVFLIFAGTVAVGSVVWWYQRRPRLAIETQENSHDRSI